MIQRQRKLTERQIEREECKSDTKTEEINRKTDRERSV